MELLTTDTLKTSGFSSLKELIVFSPYVKGTPIYEVCAFYTDANKSVMAGYKSEK